MISRVSGSQVCNPGDIGRTDSVAPGCAQPEDIFDPQIDDFVPKERGYRHFDNKPTDRQRKTISYSYLDLEKADFWPLLGFSKIERTIKRDSKKKVYFKKKERDIRFASHYDAAILEWYSYKLTEKYESILSNYNLTGCVLAYRSGIGDNITQSKLLFDDIKGRKDCFVIGLDISKFFDSIQHHILYASLQDVFSTKRLENHHFKVFRYMTQFSWVNITDIDKILGKQKRKSGRICTASEFRKIRKKYTNLINKNPNSYGIPQGTPLSGLYANISMLKCDLEIRNYIYSIGGSYRRYSDDIAIIIPQNSDLKKTIANIENIIISYDLSINSSKTEISRFSKKGSILKSDYPFQYLGFTFDGARALIRESSLQRYYIKMRRGVRAKIRAAKYNNIPQSEIYLRQLYKRYTHFGRKRSFPRYAYRAADIHQSNDIRKQMANHMKQIKFYIREAINDYY